MNRKSRKELIAEGKIKPKKESTLKIEAGESLHEFRQYIPQQYELIEGG